MSIIIEMSLNSFSFVHGFIKAFVLPLCEICGATSNSGYSYQTEHSF